jgi:hypothetical protein
MTQTPRTEANPDGLIGRGMKVSADQTPRTEADGIVSELIGLEAQHIEVGKRLAKVIVTIASIEAQARTEGLVCPNCGSINDVPARAEGLDTTKPHLKWSGNIEARAAMSYEEGFLHGKAQARTEALDVALERAAAIEPLDYYDDGGSDAFNYDRYREDVVRAILAGETEG